MREAPAEELLGQLDGALVVSSHVEDETGLHICFQDGRILVIAGYFAISVVRQTNEKLH